MSAPDSFETLVGLVGVRDPGLLGWARAVPSSHSMERAWESCPRGDWLVTVAAHLGVERRLVVRAAAACVLHVVSRTPARDVAWSVWAAVDGWTLGARSAASCQAAATAARDVLLHGTSMHDQGRAAALASVLSLALACDDKLAPACWAARADAAYSVEQVARALATFEPPLVDRLADIVRHDLPFSVIAPTLTAAHRLEPCPPESARSDEATRRTKLS